MRIRRTTPTSLPDPPDASLVDVIHALVLLQGAFALLVVVEIMFWALAGTVGSLGPSLLLTIAAAAGSLGLAAGLRRHSRLARRFTFFVEGAILMLALVDLALALLLAHRPLDLMPTITRLVMPVAVLVLLRRPSVRAVFRSGPPPSE